MRKWSVCVVFVTVFAWLYVSDVCASNKFVMRFAPPHFKNQIDYEGIRFRWTGNYNFGGHGVGIGLQANILKSSYRLLERPNLITDYSPIFDAHRGVDPVLYLVKLIDRTENVKGHSRVPDTWLVLRRISSLNDLRGYVHIRTVKDALEFLRLGSAFYTHTRVHGSIQFQEVFCTNDLHGKTGAILVTDEDCRLYGFTPVEVLSAHMPWEFEDNLPEDVYGKPVGSSIHEREPADTRPDPIAKIYRIRRTVYSNMLGKFLQITEEVGTDGSWRIADTRTITDLNQTNKHIITRRW